MCYMTPGAKLKEQLEEAATETDLLRARASTSLRDAVGHAADNGLTQVQIADATGRSQPEISRLLRAYRAAQFQATSPVGRILTRHREEIIALAQRHKASNVRIFGSVARGEDDSTSDIDILVDLAPDADLIDLAGLDIELEKLLGRKVDIVVARLLKPRVAVSALAGAVRL